MSTILTCSRSYTDVFPDVSVEVVEATSLAQTFDELELKEQDAVHDFLQTADAALKPFKWDRREEVPAAGTAGDVPPPTWKDASSALEQTKEIANPLWSSVLGKISKPERLRPTQAELCFNFRNPLVRRLAAVKDRSLVMRSVQMLYVQALLLGHHPLSAKEMALLNDGLLALIEAGIR